MDTEQNVVHFDVRRTPSVRQVVWSVGGWIPKGYGPADDQIRK